MVRRFNTDLLKRMCEGNVPPISPEQLAAATKVSAVMARLWLRGSQPTLANADRIARYFGKSLEFFLVEDDASAATAGR